MLRVFVQLMDNDNRIMCCIHPQLVNQSECDSSDITHFNGAFFGTTCQLYAIKVLE